MTEGRCDYCWRPGTAIVYLRRSPLRAMLGRPRRARRVCADHLDRARRPGGRHG